MGGARTGIKPRGAATACVLTWGQDLEEFSDAAQRTLGGPPDLILAADVLYQRDGRQLEALCATLKRLATPSDANPRGARLILTHRSRHAELDDALPAEMLERAGVALTEVPYEEHHPEYRSSAVKVWVGISEWA